MITKDLKEFVTEKINYEKELNETDVSEEKEALKKAFVDNLKLYLFETKAKIKEVFHTELTPFKTDTSKYNGLFNKNSTNTIVKKTKIEFYNEIDNLAQSSMYLSLDEEQKKLVDSAFCVLKTYYEDSLE